MSHNVLMANVPCYECKFAASTHAHPLVPQGRICESCREGLLEQPIRTVDALPPRKRSPRSTTGKRPTPTQAAFLSLVRANGSVGFDNFFAATFGVSFATLNACRTRGWVHSVAHDVDTNCTTYRLTPAGERALLGGAQ